MIPESFHLECRYHYSLLNYAEKKFYEFLVERIMNLELEFFFVQKDYMIEEVPEDKKSLPRFVCPNEECIDSINVGLVYQSIHLDCPEFFYVSNCAMAHNSFYGTMDIGYGKPEYPIEEIKEYNRKIDEIYKKFEHITDDFEYELAVHNYIIDTFDYDNEGKGNKIGLEYLEMYTFVGFFKTGRAVCEAYTDLMQLLLLKRGIPCAHLLGDAGDEGDREYHAWLAVKLGGSYYHLDVTFDDSDDEDMQVPRHTHFNVTDEEIREDHEFNSSLYPGIECNETKYNYYRYFGLYYDTEEEIKAAAEKFIAENRGVGERRYLEFKANKSIPSQTVMDIITAVCHKHVTDFDGYLYTPSVYSFVFDFKKE